MHTHIHTERGVYMYTYTHVMHIYSCTHREKCTHCTYTHTFICTYIHAHTEVHTHVHIHTYTCTYIHERTKRCAHACTHTHLHAHIFMHTHKHTCTQKHRNKWESQQMLRHHSVTVVFLDAPLLSISDLSLLLMHIKPPSDVGATLLGSTDVSVGAGKVKK